MQFKSWFLKEFTGDSGTAGPLVPPSVGDRRYAQAGIKSKWKVQEMKKMKSNTTK